MPLRTLLPPLFIALAISTAPVSAADQPIREGGQYHPINPPVATTVKPGQIEVVEMFFYACPHCYRLDPKIRAWRKRQPDDVVFRRVPAIVGPTWPDQARAYYIAEELGILDSFHPAFFDSIHKDGKQYYNRLALIQFFVAQGIDGNKVAALYDSPEVAEKTNQARLLTVKYGLNGVPAMIVDGRYKTASYYTRNLDEMLTVVDHLTAKVRADPKVPAISKATTETTPDTGNGKQE